MSDRRLPRLCPGGTAVCIASGPSLTTEDVEYVRGKATVIAVNDAVLWTSTPPVNKWNGWRGDTGWADVFVGVDELWWDSHFRSMRDFPGVKVRVNPGQQKMSKSPSYKYCQGCQRRLPDPTKRNCWCEGIVTLFNGGAIGLSMEPDTICTAHNSGGAAINAAVHLGASRVLLLGYDMGIDERGRRHFFDTEATCVTSAFQTFRKRIATMVDPLKAAGVEVVNCSRRSALECFPCQPLREALV